MLFLSWQKKTGQIVSIIFFMFPTIQAKVTQQIDLTPIYSSSETTVLKKERRNYVHMYLFRVGSSPVFPRHFYPRTDLFVTQGTLHLHTLCLKELVLTSLSALDPDIRPSRWDMTNTVFCFMLLL